MSDLVNIGVGPGLLADDPFATDWRVYAVCPCGGMWYESGGWIAFPDKVCPCCGRTKRKAKLRIARAVYRRTKPYRWWNPFTWRAGEWEWEFKLEEEGDG